MVCGCTEGGSHAILLVALTIARRRCKFHGSFAVAASSDGLEARDGSNGGCMGSSCHFWKVLLLQCSGSVCLSSDVFLFLKAIVTGIVYQESTIKCSTNPFTGGAGHLLGTACELPPN